MSDIRLRAACQSDARALATLRVQVWRDAFRGLFPDEYLDDMDIEESVAMWEKVLSSDLAARAVVVVAERGHELVGFAGGFVLDESRHGADAELTAVYLRADVRQSGWGTRLVEQVVAACRDMGARSMIAWVLRDAKPACSFFESLGASAVVEQAFVWDEVELIELGYVWSDVTPLH